MLSDQAQMLSRVSAATTVLDPLEDGRWQRLLDASPNATIFHHPAWLSLLREQYRYPIEALCVCDGDGELSAGLPLARIESRLTGRRLVALPFSDLCGPVERVPGEQPPMVMLAELLEERHRADGLDIEVREHVPGLRAQAGTRFFHHALALQDDADSIRAALPSSVRRGIARAERSGVQVEHHTSERALEEFYALHLHTRRRQGVPTQPKSFIRRFAGLFAQGLGFVLVARVDERPAAAAVFLSYKGVLTYKYGASDQRALDKRPNNALFMSAIEWGCEHGQQVLDMGRTDADNEGLRVFKRRWGATERELGYSLLAQRPVNAARSGVPGPLRGLISRTPPATGRLLGAALYRHFG